MSAATAEALSAHAESALPRERSVSTAPFDPPAVPVIRPEDQWSLDPSKRGVAVHTLIGELLAVTRSPSARMIAAAVRAHPLLDGRPVIHRQMIKQHLSSAVSSYFARFAPCELFDFVGAGMRAGGCEFDLLWRDGRDGSLLADELKTGVLGIRYSRVHLDAQVERQRCAGLALFGGRFRGVRAIVLSDPGDSFFLDRSGERAPLPWEVG